MIPVSQPTFMGNEKKYVKDCLKTNWISSSGKYIKLFEDKFAKYIGCKHGITCSNGTTALHLALKALDIKEGDEVIVPNFCMIAVPNSVIYCGAKPVFVEVNDYAWNINYDLIEKKITKNTKAIIAVHNFGVPCAMRIICKIAKKYGLKVIEDCSECHGLEHNYKMFGSFGDIACFSLYANKIITSGEGGIIVTNNEKLAEKCRLLKNHYFSEPRFIHKDIGYNYRMTNIQCAIALAQLEKIDKILSKRQKIREQYVKYLRDIKGIKMHYCFVCWMFCILVDKKKFGIGKDELMKILKEKGIETRSLFYPNNKQPAYKFLKDSGKYPVSDKLYKEGLYLPTYNSLSKRNIKKICKIIKEAYKQ